MGSPTLKGLVIGVQQGNTSQPVADKLVGKPGRLTRENLVRRRLSRPFRRIRRNSIRQCMRALVIFAAPGVAFHPRDRLHPPAVM
jgi:hypothetical protein